jgi:hypothetical protein
MALLHIALVPERPEALDLTEVSRVAAAIQRQVSRDFTPVWQVDATVDAFARLELVPLGYWPVILTDRELGDDEGFHLTANGEPFSVVEVAPGWSLTASHEILEMLVDPAGTRTIPGAGPSGDGTPARVEFLVEICDPCQSAAFAYGVNDVLVSDFVTPAFFGPVVSGPKQAMGPYSFGGNVDAPHRLAQGGAMTWIDRARGVLVHAVCDETGQSRETVIPFDPSDARPARARVHHMVKDRRPATRVAGIVHTLKSTNQQLTAGAASRARAQVFLQQLARFGKPEAAKLVVPGDELVKQKIDAALARLAALRASSTPNSQPADAELETLLEQAKSELAQPASKSGQEQFALSLVRGALRTPIGKGVLTARDVPGLSQYDQEDIRWAKALLEYAFHNKAKFPVCPLRAEPSLVHPISDAAVIALAGDWGTHNDSSANIGKAIGRMRPTHTVHLGDVYYAGTEEEERKFINDWPGGSEGTFTLNSNHEMYSGGAPYFGIALQSDKFNTQTYSYFALASSKWLLIGLDSAYRATAAGVTPYDVGHLPEDDPQVAWLGRLLASDVARDAQGAQKKICLLTHHQALDVHGNTTALFDEVRLALGFAPELWYWGHIHGAAVYEPRAVGPVAFRGRLIGHGGIPYISDFDPANDAQARVAWAERSVQNTLGKNGFAVLRLAGAEIKEEFYDELGGQRYSTVVSA